MPAPELGKPLPRAESAFVHDEKWNGYVLAGSGHGADWRAVFGDIDSDALWSIMAEVVIGAPIEEVHDLAAFGVTCSVPMLLTINSRTARIRTVWHYDQAGSAPRLVTAFPTT